MLIWEWAQAKNQRKGVEENANRNGLTGPSKTDGAGGGPWPSNFFTKQNLFSRFQLKY